MKKSLVILTSLILLCIMIVGCGNTDATITASTELNKNLNLLSNTVKRLDTIDNEYLVSNEIYSLKNNSVPTQQRAVKNVLASSNNVIIEDQTDNNLEVEEINLRDNLKEALSNELINRIYCDENGNCKICKTPYTCNDNNMCNNCNQTIICDSNGNCTTCNDSLILDENNNCNSCKTTCISTTPNINLNDDTKLLLNKISDHNKDYQIEFLSTNNVNDVYVDDNINNVNDKIYTDNDYNTHYNNINSNYNSNTDNIANNNNNQSIPQYKLFYYSENSSIPELRYRPRFINNINYETANENMNSYIEKLQKLYTMTADVVEANNTLANYKILILDNINETKDLNNCILSGNCTPSNSQLTALNNYIDDIELTIGSLRKLNGNLTNEINKISNSNRGISHSIDVTNSNYLRILNQIDTRISYHENAMATLEQIKYLLQDAQNNSNSDLVVEDLNDNTTNLEDNITIEDDYNNTTVTDDIIYNDDINDNLLDEYNDENNSNEYESYIEDNNEITITENEDADEIIEDTDDIIENNDIEDSFGSNIDTYQDNYYNLDINDHNIDNQELQSEENNNLEYNNNGIDNNGNFVELPTNNDNDNVANYNNAPQMVDGNAQNLLNNNNTNNAFANYDNDNTIISQNNLNNNDLGNNSYRYDSTGALYNNTNGYNNVYNNNLNNNNNNVNTYKYNTLIDSINRGTIDNGINNL